MKRTKITMKPQIMKVTSVVVGASMMLMAGGTSVCAETADGEKTVLTGYTMYVDSLAMTEAIVFNECVKEFQEMHPEVDFQMEQVPSDMYVTKLQAAAAADELPMLFPALSSYQQTYAASNQILVLNEYLDADQEWKEGFIEGAFDDQTIGEDIYAIPYENLLSNVIFYNKDIFAECGITEFPKTLDEFKTVCTAIAEKGYIPIAIGNKTKDPLSSVVAPGIVFKYVSQDWYNNVKNYNGAKFTDPEYIEAIKALGELIEMGAFNPDMNSLDGAVAIGQYYYTGKAAMVINGTWGVSTMINECLEEILNVTSVAAMPGNNPEYEAQVPGGTGWGWCVGANGDEKQTELAIEFLKLLTSKSTHQKIIDSGSISAVNVSPSADTELHPLFKEFLKLRESITMVPTPEIQLNSEYVNASYVGYQDYSIGAITAEELAEKLQQAHESGQK